MSSVPFVTARPRSEVPSGPSINSGKIVKTSIRIESRLATRLPTHRLRGRRATARMRSVRLRKRGSMEYLILAVALLGAGLVGFEAYRKRRHRQERLDVGELVAARIGQPSSTAGAMSFIAERVRQDPTARWSVDEDALEDGEEEAAEEEELEDGDGDEP